jgi:hypothetical protein
MTARRLIWSGVQGSPPPRLGPLPGACGGSPAPLGPRPSRLGPDDCVRSPLSYALTRVSTSPRASRARSSSSRLYVVRLKQSSGETSYLIGRCHTSSFCHVPNTCRSTLSTATAFRIGPATLCDTLTGRWCASQACMTAGSSRHARLGRTCLLFVASLLTGGSLGMTRHWNLFGSETCCQCATYGLSHSC